MNKLLLFIVFFISISIAQGQDKETETIKSLVVKWNDIHNKNAVEELAKLYAPTVLFYGKYRDQQQCLNTKRKLLNASFQQEIISPISVFYYSSGSIKSVFTKKVVYNKRVREYPAYLLFEKQGEKYFITGESDAVTDRNLHVQLSIGEEVTPLTGTSSSSPLWYSIFGIVTVSLCGIYFYRRVKNRQVVNLLNAPSTHEEKPEVQSTRTTILDSFTSDLTSQLKAEQVEDVSIPPTTNTIESENKGHDFEKYIVERFSEEHYTIIEWRGDKFHEGRYATSNMLPDLELRLVTKYYNVTFAVECKWRKEFYDGKITWAKDYQLQNYNDYEYKTGNTVFVIIGIGGEPTNPDALYIIPLLEIKSTVLTQSQMKKYYRYSKSNFFLHADGMVLS